MTKQQRSIAKDLLRMLRRHDDNYVADLAAVSFAYVGARIIRPGFDSYGEHRDPLEPAKAAMRDQRRRDHDAH